MPLSRAQVEALVRKGPGAPDLRDFARARDFEVEYMVDPKSTQWVVSFTAESKRMRVRVDNTADVVMWGTLEIIQSLA